MPERPKSTGRPKRAALFERGQQFAIAVLLLSGLVSLSGYWAWRGLIRGRLIDIDHSAPLAVRFQVDLNKADWPELAQLPGVGEKMARRIVDERTARGPFADHEDLRLRVRGIGPRSLERIRPFLLPMPESHNVAGGRNVPVGAGG